MYFEKRIFLMENHKSPFKMGEKINDERKRISRGSRGKEDVEFLHRGHPWLLQNCLFSSFPCAPVYTVHSTKISNAALITQLHTQTKSPTNNIKMANYENKPFPTSYLNSLI